jgi:hypothetical protein
VLVSAQVVSRRTDPDTLKSTVLVQLDVQGGEVSDQTIRVRRTLRAMDPDSPLVYLTDEPGEECEDAPRVPAYPRLPRRCWPRWTPNRTTCPPTSRPSGTGPGRSTGPG